MKLKYKKPFVIFVSLVYFLMALSTSIFFGIGGVQFFNNPIVGLLVGLVVIIIFVDAMPDLKKKYLDHWIK